MKRLLCFVTALSILILCVGCSGQKIKKPVNFYYLKTEYTIGTEDSVIAPEIRESAGYTSDQILLTQYLRGPKGNHLTSPFPAGTALLNVEQTNRCFYITLTDSLAMLSGIELTLACSALAITCAQLTDAPIIQIQTESAMLDGEPYIVISTDSLFLADVYTDTATEGNE